jgi:hypothetical protein
MQPFPEIDREAPSAAFRNVMGGPDGPELPDQRNASLLLDIRKLIELSNVPAKLAPVYASLMNEAVSEGDDYELNAILYNLQVSRAKGGLTAKQTVEVISAEASVRARQEANLKALRGEDKSLGLNQ